ncbi:MAG: flagellar basal body L-ring protein FlgH [Candidatus Glassbacteria bacterium]|nr:flagellar basal body L-ring protein FlgH [Candidatus Glassbacteria bacterium]
MRTIKSKPRSFPPRSGPPPQPRILNNLLGAAALVILWAVPLLGQMEFRGPVSSLFTDERLYKSGDVVTIIVDERVSGVNRQQFRSQRGTQTQAEFGAGPGKVFGLLNPFSGEISAQNNFDSRIQNNKLSTFATNVSVRVARTDELGNLFLEGSKVVDLPDEKLVVFITGVARSQDVTPQNTVLSSQLANLQVTMKSKGEAEDARRPTIFNRILGWFF